MANSTANKATCDVCGLGVTFGPNVYDGKFIKRYNLMVCSTCYAGNWDGWGPMAEPIILRKLKAAGLPEPPRNAKRLLPRGE